MHRLLPALVCLLASPIVAVAADTSVSFHDHVMAVLSRAGCNQGACHGNLNGKGGFKLSLRGQDADFDFLALTRDQLGRRVDRLNPEASLLLLKATGTVAHEGGKRFDRNSLEYRLLRGWIAGGLAGDVPGAPRLQRIEVTPAQVLVEPIDHFPLHVEAIFSNGQHRDVTALACFDPANLNVEVDRQGIVHRKRFGNTAILVRYLDQQATIVVDFVPARPGFVWTNPGENNLIDHHVLARLKTLRMLPSPLASDALFLRRVYLDTLGILPTVDESRQFLADTRTDKRDRLIEALLQRPEFADFWALKWSDLLRNEEKTLDHKGVQLFHHWLRQQIEEGQPLNEMARALVSSRGSTYADPAANYYRALRDPNTRAEAFAQVFLGIRLQCARCHNHPFDRWTQDDYHGLAACFARIQYRIVENKRGDNLDSHEFKGEQIVWMDRTSELPHPRTGKATRPTLLGQPNLILPANEDRLLALADWVARPSNPFFARAQVNRIWAHLIGRGLVDPIDDFRASNPSSHPPLLDALEHEFVEHHFDLRYLVGLILRSRTYQLSDLPNETNGDDDTGFAHALARPLQAEQLLDALAEVTGVASTFPGYRPGMRAGQLPGVGMSHERRTASTTGERFLAVFGKPGRSLSCECERSEDSTLAQAFQLITGPLLNDKLSKPNNRLGKLLTAGNSSESLVGEFYLAALCRHPSASEKAAALRLLNKATDRRAALEDLVWGLVNAKEFLLRR